MMKVLFLWSVICGVWGVSIYLVRRLDKPIWKVSHKEYSILLMISVLNALLLVAKSQDFRTTLWMAVVAGSFLFACITDCKAYEVYQFTWWIAGVASIMMLLAIWQRTEHSLQNTLPELLFFCVLQEFLFCRWYGRADCHAFVICALVSWRNGMGMKDCLVQMLIAFGILAVMQFGRQNINRKGNLKEPVAFLPYITVSFWINYGCFCSEKMIY